MAETTHVVSVAAFRHGRFLLGRRRDTGRWCFPGGHLEPDEVARITGVGTHDAARRELLEETALAPVGSLVPVGSCDMPGKSVRVYTFACRVGDHPSADRDPDDEFVEFRWVYPRAISRELRASLHNPEDVTLQFLRLQDQTLPLVWDEDFEDSDLGAIAGHPTWHWKRGFHAGLKKAEGDEPQDDVTRAIRAARSGDDVTLALKLPGVARDHLREALRFERDRSASFEDDVDKVVGATLASSACDEGLVHEVFDGPREFNQAIVRSLAKRLIDARDPRVDAHDLDAVLRDPSPFGDEVTLGALSDRRTPVDSISRWLGTVRQPTNRVDSALARRFGLEDDKGNEASGATERDVLDASRLAREHGSKVDSLMDAVASRAKSIPQSVQDDLLGSGQLLSYKLLHNPAVSPDTVRKVVAAESSKGLLDRNQALLGAAAKHAPPDLLDKLAADPDVVVRAAVLKSPNLPLDRVKRVVARGTESDVQAISQRLDLTPEVYGALATREPGSIPATAAENLVNGAPDRASLDAVARVAPRPGGKWLTELVKHPAADEALVRSCSSDPVTTSSMLVEYDQAARMRGDPGLSPQTVAELAGPSRNGYSRQYALRDPRCPPAATQAALAEGEKLEADRKGSGDDLLKSVASNPNATDADLDRVLTATREMDSRAAAAAYEHPALSGATLGKHLASAPHAWLALDALGDQLTPEQVAQAAQNPRPSARLRAAAHPAATREVLEALADDPDNAVAAATLKSPNVPDSAVARVASRRIPDPDVQKLLAAHDPDSAYKERVGVRFDTGKLRKVRDLITSVPGRTSMRPKDLPPGDWSAGRGKDGNIHAELLQRAIDAKPVQSYNVSHSAWNGAQRHSVEPSKVFQLSATTDQVRRMKAAGVYGTFRKMHEASMQSEHPVAPVHGIGWVRYTESDSKPKTAVCDACNGSGEWECDHCDGTGKDKCTSCDGSGRVEDECQDCEGAGEGSYTCRECRGKGQVGDEDCSDCEGTGSVKFECGTCEGTGKLEADCPRCEGEGRSDECERCGGVGEEECSECRGTGGSDEPAPNQTGPRSPRDGKPGEFFVDEVQSDLGQAFAKQAAAQAKEQGADSVEAEKRAEAAYPTAHYEQIKQILFGGKHPNEVLEEAFEQHLRDRGHVGATTQIHTVESKAPISLGRKLSEVCGTCGLSEGAHTRRPGPEFKSIDHEYVPKADRTSAPGHFNVSYHDVPKKMGMEPSTYGKLKTQRAERSDEPIEAGAPTWEGKVRKAEHALQAQVAARAKIEEVGKFAECTVWSVDGPRLRDEVDVDFTEGGNHGRYSWIPPDEIWLEVTPDAMDDSACAVHEYHERKLMAAGESYDAAHTAASEVEVRFRAQHAGHEPTVEDAAAWYAEDDRRGLEKSEPKDYVPAVVSALSEDLRREKYRGNPSPVAGHCYVASEALYHLMGGAKSGFIPHSVQHEGDVHWFLKHRRTGEVVDATASQFKTPVPYGAGRGRGFLTAYPSRRAQVVIDRVRGTTRKFEDDLTVWLGCLPLRKGAMRRIAPFDPAKQRMDPRDESSISRWQSADREPEDRDAGYMTGSARVRALHNLSSATATRRDPATGERQFLMHRGMGPEEHAAATKEPGYVAHSDSTSWTPEYTIARGFSQEYGAGQWQNHLVSAWIPESSISMVPKQYGALDPGAELNEGVEGIGPLRGANAYGGEHEVIVGEHRSQLATPEEVAARRKPLTTLHGRINEAGRQDKNLRGVEDYDLARVDLLRQRMAGRTAKSEVPLAKMAVKPSDMKPVARYHSHAGLDAVDHSAEATAHPASHDAHVQAFKAQVLDRPELVRRGKTGTREASNSTGKVVYDVHHAVGDQSEHRFMVKPYAEKVVPRVRKWVQHPYHGGWAEMTNQALYHAGGIGDLHQAVHVAHVPMEHQPTAAEKRKNLATYEAAQQGAYAEYERAHAPGQPWVDWLASNEGHPAVKAFRAADWHQGPTKATEPVLVVHMQPGVKRVVDHLNDEFKWGRSSSDKLRGQAQKVALMDFLSNNLDRHRDNLLVDPATDSLLAIDHSRSFQYKAGDKGWGKVGLQDPDRSDSLFGYTNDSALSGLVGPASRRTGYGEGWDQDAVDRDYWNAVDAYNESWNPTFQWWEKNSPAIRKAFGERVKMVRDPELQAHLLRNFEARARQLDQYAEFGHENFGHEPREWMSATVPIYRPGEPD